MTPNKYLRGRSGIYGIRNLVNGKIYIGKTNCMYSRCSQYIYDFKARRIGHLNDYLYHAMKKLGLQEFEFFPIEFCTQNALAEAELRWITQLNSLNRNKGYNLRLDSSSGYVTSPETSSKIVTNLKEQWATGVRDGHSDKMKASWATADENRRVEQSQRMQKTKTKFKYNLCFPDGSIEVGCNFKRLVELNLKNSLCSFSLKKSNLVKCKGVLIERYPIGEHNAN